MGKLRNNQNNNQVLKNIWKTYKNSALSIRGTDGQVPTTQKNIKNWIKGSQTFQLSQPGNEATYPNLSLTNPLYFPWANWLQNSGPTYSATFIGKNSKYPIVWYVPSFVDQFYNQETPPGSFTPNPTPKIGSRNQGAWLLKKYKLFGVALADGDTNDDRSGNSIIPALPGINGNRGGPLSGFILDQPYRGINLKTNKLVQDNTSYSPPNTMNTNINTNPVLSADPFQLGVKNDKKRDEILGNMIKIKKLVWDSYIGGKGKLLKKKKVQDNLDLIWGSGIEQEGFIAPDQYSEGINVWSNKTRDDRQRFNVTDFYSINISSDSKDYTSWIKQHTKKSIITTYQAIYTSAINTNKIPGWINQPNQNIKIPLTLITGVILPEVSLQGPGVGVSTAQQFNSYIQQGYGKLKKSSFLHLGYFHTGDQSVKLFGTAKILN